MPVTEAGINQDIQRALNGLMDKYGERRLVAQLVEVFAAKAQMAEVGSPYRRIAKEMHYAVHWTGLEWPT